MFETPDAPEPAKKINVAKPAIGIAISFCLLVASALAGVVVLCGGGGGGFNGAPGTGTQKAVGPLFVALMSLSALGLVVCFLWLMVAVIRRGLQD